MDNLTRLRALDGQIQDLRDERAVVLADLARDEVRKVCPEAALVLFEGPQEPGHTAMILQLIAADGGVLYDLEDDAEGDGFDDTDLSPAQDYLSGALEDNALVFALSPDGTYLLPVPCS